MVTSAADLGDLQTKPNQIMHIYPYMVTSAADLSDLKTKPNQIMHIHPYMINLYEKASLCFMVVCLIKSNCYSLIYSSLSPLHCP